jgi:serine/threonine protein kinase
MDGMAEPVSTIDEFLTVVKKSGLVEEALLEAACAAWPDRTQPVPDELVAKLVGDELLTQWQIDQLRKGKHRGFLLGKYKLLRLLGAGGMSSVYLAEHVNLHGKVAIKVLPVKNVDKTSYLARFEREARAAFRLSHPNIARAIDLDTSGAIHYLAMDYVDGIDLHAKVKQDGPLPVHDAVDYVRQAALGLQYAHEAGVFHRDIKPANLILDSRGTKPVIKILDFGLALAGKGEDDGSLTQEYGEKVLGTADYLAPEQAKDSHLADARSDIYALGCTLYYLLVGKVPFAGGKLAERIRAHQDAKPPNPLDARPDVPPAIVELYFRMLEKHPEARPQSAREVADALGAWLAASKAATGPTMPPSRPPPRRPAAPATGGAAPSKTGVAVLAPPGSGAGRRPPGSGAGPSSLVFTPPPASGVGRSAKLPVAGGRPAATKAAAKAGGKAATDDADEVGKPARPRRSWSFAGLPLGFWLLALAFLGLAIGLGYMVFAKQQARGAKSKKQAPAATSTTAPDKKSEAAAATDAESTDPAADPDDGKPGDAAGTDEQGPEVK